MKKEIKNLVLVMFLCVLFVPALHVKAANTPATPTGLGIYSQKAGKFALTWDIDNNLPYYGVDVNQSGYGAFGFELTVTTLKNKMIGTYDKNTIDNNYDSNWGPEDNKIFMIISKSTMKKQGFKFKVRSYVYDENLQKVYSDYSKEKVVIPRATAKKIKALSNTSGRLSWDKVSGAKSYTVYISSNNGKTYKKCGTSKTTSLVIKNMKLNKIYQVYIIANDVKYKKKKFSSTTPKKKKISNVCKVKIYSY